MKFTPSQVMVLASVSQQTLRYWKKHLLPISGHKGQSPCYSRSEVLALIVVRRLVHEFMLDISALGAHSHQLFQLCGEFQWAKPQNRLLLVDSSGEVRTTATLAEHEISAPCIVFPLDAALLELAQKLDEHDPRTQLPLTLPPVALVTKPRRVG